MKTTLNGRVYENGARSGLVVGAMLSTFPLGVAPPLAAPNTFGRGSALANMESQNQ